MQSSKIEDQYNLFREIHEYLLQRREVTFAMDIGETYKKTLLLSAASYFETTIITFIYEYAKKSCKSDKRIVDFIQNKLLTRQYYQLFDWKANNTNAFWKLFGEKTKSKVRHEIDSNPVLKEAESNFIKLFTERNNVVHKNFAEYTVNITIEEIYALYSSACQFILLIEKVFDPAYENED